MLYVSKILDDVAQDWIFLMSEKILNSYHIIFFILIHNILNII